MNRSTFSVLFYVNKGKVKNGTAPVMGRITINGTQSQFSCKRSIPLTMWDVKGNCVKGRSREALDLNRDLDNIKAQIIKHYQHLSDRDAFVTAEMVRNSYQGFGNIQVAVEVKELYSELLADMPQTQRHFHAGTDTRLHQGVQRLPQQ